MVLITGGQAVPEAQANIHQNTTENAPTTQMINLLINRGLSTDSIFNVPIFKSLENIHNPWKHSHINSHGNWNKISDETCNFTDKKLKM